MARVACGNCGRGSPGARWRARAYGFRDRSRAGSKEGARSREKDSCKKESADEKEEGSKKKRKEEVRKEEKPGKEEEIREGEKEAVMRLHVRRRHRVRVLRGPITGSAPSRTHEA